MMHKYIERARVEGKTIEEMGKILVDEYMDAGPGGDGVWGSPQHLDGDPRAEPTHIKHEQLCSGVYLELQRAIEKHFATRGEKGRQGLRVGEHDRRRQYGPRGDGLLPRTPPGASVASAAVSAARPTPPTR